ncbi:MAG: acyltransferase domain-containing protein [Actinophytocola sp.]|uniref:acyltransferase domain-containing protein n=1 Tax=Actinophytocola sp. TaxID=1872138 RepID=UPI003C75C8DA
MSGNRLDVAVVGMACRLPGDIAGTADFWEFSRSRSCTVGDVPEGRWDDYSEVSPESASALRGTSRRGSFLDDPFAFDARFFGISPGEAAQMDPQHRLLLEVAWEAVEDAGLSAAGLAGGRSGVFVGIGPSDYGRRLLEDLPRVQAWSGIGAGQCAAANRISYALDLRGPSLSVDTACSASLVAAHLACRSLAAGESDLAIVGGVALSLAPGPVRSLQLAGALAPDGRSRPFAADAAGYGRGEGCGVVVLQRLADAQRAGNPVLAVILGGAVCQDGRTQGIMEPSETAQAAMIRAACACAEVDPGEVDYVEAHGTGTRRGDRAELAALADVYGAARSRVTPCAIGSVKGGIGHLEAAAGVVGLIHAVLMLRHELIPGLAGSVLPSSEVDWPASGLALATEPRSWPRQAGRPRRAAVSSFGYGGTIAHLVVAEAPEVEPSARAPQRDRPRIVVCSAASPEALSMYTSRLADRIRDADSLSVEDVAHTLANRRTHMRHRMAAVAVDRDGLLAALDGHRPGAVVSGRVPHGTPREPVWVFSGHGSQWAGMGRSLVDTEPAFAAALAALEPVFDDELGVSPGKLLESGDFPGVDRIQPLIFAMQIGLAAVCRAYGLRPGAVLGHSVGEIAAAVTAGVLTPDDGARLVCRRSVLLRRAAGRGRMALVSLSPERVHEELTGRRDVVVAVHAGPNASVISGDPAPVAELADTWRDRGLTVRDVAADVAFHSPHMDPLTRRLTSAVAGLAHHRAAVPVYSTVAPGTTMFGPDYWAANLRRPVLFREAIAAALADGYRTFAELAPHPVVTHSIHEVLDDAGVAEALATGTLRRGQDERTAIYTAFAQLHCAGVSLDWTALAPGSLARLPGTVWQHNSYRLPGPVGTPAPALHDPAGHTLLGRRITGPTRSGLTCWRTWLAPDNKPYPGTNTVDGSETVPSAVLLATLAAAAPGSALSDVVLGVPLTGEPREVWVTRQDGRLEITSGVPGDPDSHLSGAIGGPPPPHALTAPSVPGPSEGGDPDATGTAFAWHSRSVTSGQPCAVVSMPEGSAGSWAPVLDAALWLGCPGGTPGRIGRLALYGRPGRTVIIQSRPGPGDRIEVFDPHHGLIAALDDVQFEPPAPARPQDLVFGQVWRTGSAEPDAAAPRRLVLIGTPEQAAVFQRAATGACLVVADPGRLDERHLGDHTDAVLVLAPPQADAPPAELAARSALRLIQAAQRLAAAPAGPRLWATTQRAAAGHAALFGLGRIIESEYPHLWGGVLDLDMPEPDDRVAAAALAVLGQARGESVIRVDESGWSVPRLVAGPGERSRMRCRPDASYLITGGLGALGTATARWLVRCGARRLVLLSRTPLPSRDRWEHGDPRVTVVRSLESVGATVRVVAADAADPVALRRALSPDVLDLPPVAGVVHAAGVLADRTVAETDEASLRAVFRPKVGGACALHELFPPGTLDFFVLFSSCGHLLGLPGQAAYAAANSFLDGLAHQRRAAGCAGSVSLAWTSWRGLGMGANAVVDAELRAAGIGKLTQAAAFAAWEYATAGPYAVVLPLLPGTARPRTSVMAELAASPADARARPEIAAQDTAEVIREVVTADLGIARADLDDHAPLLGLGIDSVLSVVLRGRLEQALHTRLPVTILLTSPTLADVIEQVRRGDPR